ncbi:MULTISPECIES: helix-turn-helix transcriptional regulator [unclassified Leucobacter]|uniref:helix-turn-helix transcriptional regulator n=1 Tax=unclassified Leucobacter TaxID=2621730 RepID=UPI00301663D8
MYREVAIPSLGVLWMASPSEHATTIPADGCADLILRDDELIVAGPSTRWLVAQGSRQGATVGLRFTPGFAGALFGADVAEVRDRVLPARDLLSASHSDRGERALRAPLSSRSLHEAAGAVAGSLDLDPDIADLRWTAIVSSAAVRGDPFPQLAARLGYSERQLRRRMQQSFGYGYAALRGVLRAERARGMLVSGALPAEVAQRAGYADQSHMTRDFTRIIGSTPGRLTAPEPPGRPGDPTSGGV